VILATLAPLQTVLLALVALAAPLVVLTREPIRMIFVNGIYGHLLVLVFVMYGAPDVALSMLVVSTVAYPLVVLIAVARTRNRGKGEDE
jgi:energy-converting hydrogenase B subunit D